MQNRSANSHWQLQGQRFVRADSTARDDFYYLQPVARVEPTPGKFRRRDRLAIVLDDDAARQKLLRDQEFLKGARQLRLNRLSVGGDKI